MATPDFLINPDAQVEIHRNGINAHQRNHTFYALDADTRTQITSECSYGYVINELLSKGYQRKNFIKCW